jgi:RHS repeat-associated protein
VQRLLRACVKFFFLNHLAYLNYILFDQNFNILDMGWVPAPGTTFTKQKLSFPTKTIKEAGYMFVYLSYDNDSNNWVFFDDFKVTHTKTNVIQYNEYYPFGLQTASSWTRDEATDNAYLYNGGSELNATTSWYETFFRGYDATLGRFLQVDPLAHQASSFTPYNYAFNNPVMFNDPMGDYPSWVPQTWDDAARWKAGGGINVSGYRGPGSGRHWSDGFRPAWWGAGSNNLMISVGNLSINFNQLSDGVHHFSFTNGVVSNYGWAPDPYTPMMSADDAANHRQLRQIYPSMSVGDGRSLAVNNFNGDFVQIAADGKVYIPYTNISYWGNASAQQGNYQVLQAGFGIGEGLGSLELALAGLKPTFDRAAHFARSQGGRGQVPLYLIKNVFKSPLLENNKALYLGRVSSSTALGTANTLSKLAPALTGLGILTNGYDIIKDGQLTAGDGFQAINTGLMVAFPVYGVIYGAVDLGFAVFSDQSLTDRIKTGIDSNVSGSIKF